MLSKCFKGNIMSPQGIYFFYYQNTNTPCYCFHKKFYRPVPPEQRRQRHQGGRGPDQDHHKPHLEHRHPVQGHMDTWTHGHMDTCGDARDAGPVWLGVHDAEDDPGALQRDTADQPDGHHARHQRHVPVQLTTRSK